MKNIEILLQGEDIPDIQVVVIEHENAKGHQLLAKAAEHRKTKNNEGEFLIFMEDVDEPLDPGKTLPKSEKGSPCRMHVHRCRAIAVSVTFNGTTAEHRFGPGTTVEKVKRWAAIERFGMSPADAAEHVLQLAGTTVRPEPDTHLGSLTGNSCSVRFDLVPLKRVEG
ncbi:MAG TPA: hypothetical protein VEF76_04320 [Patescibacteria group bacterium]|nr:hypothetical protein [Patescibacteria group bacterium]